MTRDRVHRRTMTMAMIGNRFGVVYVKSRVFRLPVRFPACRSLPLSIGTSYPQPKENDNPPICSYHSAPSYTDCRHARAPCRMFQMHWADLMTDMLIPDSTERCHQVQGSCNGATIPELLSCHVTPQHMNTTDSLLLSHHLTDKDVRSALR
jgi:hypothetical protein